MKTKIGAGGLAVLLGAVLTTGAWCENASPELPIVEWTKGTVSLEDFKGQVTALVFFDDDTS
jgi:hypothetical protein